MVYLVLALKIGSPEGSRVRRLINLRMKVWLNKTPLVKPPAVIADSPSNTPLVNNNKQPNGI